MDTSSIIGLVIWFACVLYSSRNKDLQWTPLQSLDWSFGLLVSCTPPGTKTFNGHLFNHWIGHLVCLCLVLLPEQRPSMDTSSIIGLVIWFACVLYSSRNKDLQW